MLGQNPFYYRSIRKAIVTFGNLFSNIKIERRNTITNNIEQTVKVPISFNNKQFWYSRLEQDAEAGSTNETPYSISLPRIGYNLESLNYAPQRSLSPINRLFKLNIDDNTVLTSMFSNVPWDFQFKLFIMTKHLEDGFNILEQILPFFNPFLSVTVNEIEEFPIERDLHLVFNNVTMETVDGNMNNTKYYIWELSFTLNGFLYRPIGDVKIIRTIENRTAISDGMEFLVNTVLPVPIDAFPNDSINTTTETSTINIQQEAENNLFNSFEFNTEEFS